MRWLFLLFLFLPSALLAQKTACDSTDNYIPYDARFTPVKRVRIVLHIMQKADGTGNFDPDSAGHRAFIQKMMGETKHRYFEMERSFWPEVAYIPDSRVRLVWDTSWVYYHRNDELWDLYAGGSVGKRGARTQKAYEEYVLKDSTMIFPDSAIHVFMGEGEGAKGVAEGLAAGVGSKKWVAMLACYYYMNQGQNTWIPAALFRHEIGHCLGLFHTVNGGGKTASFSEDYCSDTRAFPENKGCWEGCSNNVMDRNKDKNSLTPCQLGRIHFYLSGKAGDVHKAVIPDWKYFHPDSVVEIKENESVTFLSTKFFQGDLVLRKNARLAVRCTLHIPKGGRILLYPGAQLVVDGGLITNVFGEKWLGVEIKSAKKKRKPKKNAPPEKPPVLLLNDGKIVQN